MEGGGRADGSCDTMTPASCQASFSFRLVLITQMANATKSCDFDSRFDLLASILMPTHLPP